MLPTPASPLFGAIPGGSELLIVLVVLLVLFGPVLAVVVGLLTYTDTKTAEVERLEARVEALEREVRGDDPGDGGDGDERKDS